MFFNSKRKLLDWKLTQVAQARYLVFAAFGCGSKKWYQNGTWQMEPKTKPRFLPQLFNFEPYPFVAFLLCTSASSGPGPSTVKLGSHGGAFPNTSPGRAMSPSLQRGVFQLLV